MKLYGLPETFWLVVSPSTVSTFGDICFECDFERYALQIRGGLDEEKIVGIFADQQPAIELAERLLRAIQQATEEPAIRIHTSPWPNWLATQGSLTGVVICNEETDEQVLVKPPREWGRNWAWNITEDGSGIVIWQTACESTDVHRETTACLSNQFLKSHDHESNRRK